MASPSTPESRTEKTIPKINVIANADTEPFPIQTLCAFINPYKGERETLPAFLTNCQNALDLAKGNQKELLLKFIIAKLEGKPQIACSNKIFEKFDDLKNFLRQNFGERKHYNHLLLDLQNCKQLNNETVAQFALRIETCLTALQSEIHNSESLKKELAGRIAMTEDLALFTFTLGLNPRLSTIVRCREPKNLNAAVNVALQEEKIQNLFFQTTKAKSPVCKICNKPGHSESECYLKRRQHASNNNTTYSKNPSSNNAAPSSSQVPVCSYCKNKGHHISQCRKRQFNENRKASSFEATKCVEIDDGLGELEPYTSTSDSDLNA